MSYRDVPNDVHAYDEVVVPFLDRMITKLPVAGYPPNPPVQPLSYLLKDWSVMVRFGDRFEPVYGHGGSNKTLPVDLLGVTQPRTIAIRHPWCPP